jgi:diguanylate cyclase (GGDEF)-like protein/PAS domain S-box-containing protein
MDRMADAGKRTDFDLLHGLIDRLADLGASGPERDQARRALARIESELSLRDRIDQASNKPDNQRAMADLVSVAVEATQSGSGMLGILDEEKQLSCIAINKSDSSDLQQSRQFSQPVWSELWGRPLLEGKQTVSNYPTGTPETRSTVRSMAAPIIWQKRPIGVLVVGNKTSDYDPADQSLLSVVACAMAPAVEAKRKTDLAKRAGSAEMARLELAVRGAGEGVWEWTLDDDTFLATPQWAQSLGPGAESTFRRARDWFDRIHPDDLESVRSRIAAHLTGQIPRVDLEYRIKANDSSWRWVKTRGAAQWDQSGRPVRIAGLQNDITEQKEAEQQLVYAAIYDTLTGLFNRGYLLKRLRSAIKAAARYGHPLSLCLCDLDNFKSINDSHGHALGDEVLATVGEVLKEGIRSDDVAGRYGGDEFCVVYPHTGAKEAVTGIERIRHRLSELAIPTGDGGTVGVTATFGIAGFIAGDQDDKVLFESADQALYRAKEKGRNRIGLKIDPTNEIVIPRQNGNSQDN